MKNVSRREFLDGAAVLAGLAPILGCRASGIPSADGATGRAATDPAALQKLIDEVTPQAYSTCRRGGEPDLPALAIYDAALKRAVGEVLAADVSRHPAVAFVYNMGIVVRTKERLFAVDLCHRRSCELCDRLDFALITHNHGDHYIDAFLQELDRRGKTVITNFDDNYGAHYAKRNPGGFTRGGKTFALGDVTIRTATSDHNPYLIDFTLAFEIAVGDYTIYHTGDSQNLEKLNPTRAPDLWVVHPYCGLDVVKAARKFHPRLTALVHLNEMGHARDRWRWSFAQGESRRRALADAGFKSVVPLWGDRLV